MILGFLGKGGSGKSSVSSQMALHLNASGISVLTVDADHNMDLSYNLSGGDVPKFKYFSQSLADLQKAVGLSEGQKYTQAFLNDTDARFTLSPLSPEIDAYSYILGNNIRLMTATNSDLGPVEYEFYQLYANTFALMEPQGRDAFFDSSMQAIWSDIVLFDTVVGIQQVAA